MRGGEVKCLGRRAATGLGLIGLMVAQTACGGSSGFEAPSAGKGTTFGNLLAFNSLSSPSEAKPPNLDETPTCPGIEVLDGTASSRVFGGADQSNANVKYQFSLGNVERECAHAGDQLTLKVGAEGRALLGPVGTPGAFTAPVRIAVRREKDEKAIASKLYQIPVTIANGEAHADFSIVSDLIAVPYLSAHGDDDYTILVGFDTKGDGKLDTKPHAKKKHLPTEGQG